MGIIAIEGGDLWRAVPGTKKQPGNRAPRYPWAYTDTGRTMLILVKCTAHHLGYTDDSMAAKHEFPDGKAMYDLFIATAPWFAEDHTKLRQQKAIKRDYPLDKIQPFGPEHVRSRLLYQFTVPGCYAEYKTKGKSVKRKYGVSPENHASAEERNRRIVWARCSVEIMERLRTRQQISREEAAVWGHI
jgi:hypothetical protein